MESGLFFATGLDRFLLICPSGWVSACEDTNKEIRPRGERHAVGAAKRTFDETDKSSPPAYKSFDQGRGRLGRQCTISTGWQREAADVVSDMPMDLI
jgi:hypothetical protein